MRAGLRADALDGEVVLPQVLGVISVFATTTVHETTGLYHEADDTSSTTVTITRMMTIP